MAKNIAVADSVYEFLQARKLPEESFSKVIVRLCNKKQDISRLAGAWKRKNIDVEAMKNLIQKTRNMTANDVLAKFKRKQ
ncbi:MAG: antitoxin VapB family protein [Candidatus Woesearchaeota archaeon]|nr:antitoxin VapB family protein [Candidatus Woesearchaeota archaeon]